MCIRDSPYRGDRVNEFLGSSDSLTMEDMKKLQVDVTSLPAKSLVPYLEKVSFKILLPTFKSPLKVIRSELSFLSKI